MTSEWGIALHLLAHNVIQPDAVEALPDAICVGCGESFIRKNLSDARKIYCTSACRQRTVRNVKKEIEHEARL